MYVSIWKTIVTFIPIYRFYQTARALFPIGLCKKCCMIKMNDWIWTMIDWIEFFGSTCLRRMIPMRTSCVWSPFHLCPSTSLDPRHGRDLDLQAIGIAFGRDLCHGPLETNRCQWIHVQPFLRETNDHVRSSSLSLSLVEFWRNRTLGQACFLYTLKKTQGQKNSRFWPSAKNSRDFLPKTQGYEAQY